MSGRSLRKIIDIYAAAKADPERFGHLCDKMDDTGKVDRPYKKLIAMRKADATPSVGST